MSVYEINYENLADIDESLHVDNPDGYDREVEDIVDRLWQETGECQGLLSPFFTTYLQSNLLRPLYIHYLSLRELGNRYDRIVVKASTVVVDIVAEHLGFELDPDRSFHDEEFFLVRHYDFLESGRRRRPWWKRGVRTLVGACMRASYRFRGLDVLYLNAGKLDDDFSRIPRAMAALWVPLRRSCRVGCDAQAIGARVHENIRSMALSIPHELVIGLIDRRVLSYLPETLDRIGTLAEFIERCRVKLVIVSAVTHEDHLCLLAAANLAGVESLIMYHGISIAKNPFLDHYVTYQAALNGIEPRYKGADYFPMKASWFERNV